MITTIILISSVLLVVYIVMLRTFMLGWLVKNGRSDSILHTNLPPVCVVVACKDEAENLSNLLTSLLAQSHKPQEIIIVNDHSVDGTDAILRNFSAEYPHIKVLNAIGHGKKAALAQAVSVASADIVMCTDADCVVPTGWTDVVARAYVSQNFDLLILPVLMRSEDGNATIFEELQTLEFSTLIASGAAMAYCGHAIMCNGANLAFRREAWMACRGELHNEQVSGDDVFMLHAMKRRNYVIDCLMHEEVLVRTNPSKTLREFIKQRQRWASKAGAYRDKDTILVALNVFAINAWILLLAVCGFFVSEAWVALLIVFLVKWCVDLLFLYQTSSFFKYRNLFFNSFLLSLLYPVYMLVSLLGFKNVR